MRRGRRAPRPRASSSASSPSSASIAAPRVEASASSTGRSATRWRSTQPLGPTACTGGRERRGEPGLGDDQGLRRVRELLELRAVGARDRRFRLSFERDPLRGLARDLPVHRAGRLEHPHDLVEVDLREVDLARGRNRPPRSRCRDRRTAGAREGSDPTPARPAPPAPPAPRGHQVEEGRPRGQCMDVHAVAVTGASGLVGRHLLPLLAADPDVDARRSRSMCASPRHDRPSSSSAASTSRAPTSPRCWRGHRRGGAPRRGRRPHPRRGAHGAGQRGGHAPRARRRGRGRRARRSCGSRAPRCTARGRTTRCPSPRTRRCARTRTSRPRCRARRWSACSPSGEPGSPT